MSSKLILALILFGLTLIIITLLNVNKGKIPIKYAMVWLLSGFFILISGVAPFILEIFSSLTGIISISNIIIAIILVLLLSISLSLTIIVSRQKKSIKNLIQEISIIKESLKD